MTKRTLLLCFTLLAPILGPGAQTPGAAPDFSWRRALAVDEALSKSEMFDGYLNDLLELNSGGYKALPPVIGAQISSKSAPYYRNQGDFLPTSSQTDFAVRGDGFFKVMNDATGAMFYTRNGRFAPNVSGVLCDEEGRSLSPRAVVASAVANNLFVDENSILYSAPEDGTPPVELYRFQLFVPGSDAKVTRIRSVFAFSSELRVAPGFSRVYNKRLEMGNTRPVRTLAVMTDLLYKMKKENPGSDYSFRIYLVDFLLKRYTDAQGDDAAVAKFVQLAASISPTLAFNPSAFPYDESPAAAKTLD